MQDTKEQFLSKFKLDSTEKKKLRQEAIFVDPDIQQHYTCTICYDLAVDPIKCRNCET